MICIFQGSSLRDEDDTPLTLAIKTTNLELILLLRYHGAGVNFVDTNGNTALFAAITKSDFPIIDDLLRTGANVNHRNHEGKTPLYHAIRSGCRKDLVLYLLGSGADANLLTQNGDSVSLFASEC